MMNNFKARKFSNSAEKFTIWKEFLCSASELISPRIRSKSGEEAD
jgi:hypothetical protein